MVTPIRFVAFYSLQDGTPFLVRLTMMVVVQVNVGRLRQHELLDICQYSPFGLLDVRARRLNDDLVVAACTDHSPLVESKNAEMRTDTLPIWFGA